MIGLKDAELEFTNGIRRTIEHSGANGTFSVSLESGSYTLTVTAKGFCPSTRDFETMAVGTEQSINVALLDCADCPDMSIDFVEPLIEPDVAPSKQVNPQSLVFKYQRENLEDGQSTGPRPSILFGSRTDRGDYVEYAGLDCPGLEKLPVLQYRGGSLKARKLRFTKEDHRIRGEGEVVITDWRGISHGSIVEIDLSLGNPVAFIIR